MQLYSNCTQIICLTFTFSLTHYQPFAFTITYYLLIQICPYFTLTFLEAFETGYLEFTNFHMLLGLHAGLAKIALEKITSKVSLHCSICEKKLAFFNAFF